MANLSRSEWVAADSPPTLDDLAWDYEADAIDASALQDLRSAAEKWGTSLTAVTGALAVVGIIRGRTDLAGLGHTARIAVGVLIGLGAAMGLFAIVSAALAAQGRPRMSDRSGADTRLWFEREELSVARMLGRSRMAGVCAVILVGCAVGLTWYSPRRSPTAGPLTALLLKTGVVDCGAVVRVSDVGYSLKSATGTPALIPLAAVKTTVAVTTCKP